MMKSVLAIHSISLCLVLCLSQAAVAIDNPCQDVPAWAMWQKHTGIQITAIDCPQEVIAGISFALSVTAQDFDFYANCTTDGCPDDLYIVSVEWGDGKTTGPYDGLSATHVYDPPTGCGEQRKIRVTVDDKQIYGPNTNDTPRWHETTVFLYPELPFACSKGRDTCHGGASSRACFGDTSNFSAHFATDLWGGPSGVFYSSHPNSNKGVTLPCGTYAGGWNRGWRMYEDGHAILESNGEDDFLSIYWGGILVESYMNIGGEYYSETSDATASYSSNRVRVYRNGRLREEYGQAIVAAADYAVTEVTGTYGLSTIFEYTDISGLKALSKMTLDGLHEYTYTWTTVAGIARPVLDRIDSPDGFRLKLAYSSGKMNERFFSQYYG